MTKTLQHSENMKRDLSKTFGRLKKAQIAAENEQETRTSISEQILHIWDTRIYIFDSEIPLGNRSHFA